MPILNGDASVVPQGFDSMYEILAGTSFLFWSLVLLVLLYRTPKRFFNIDIVPGRIHYFLAFTASFLNVCHFWNEPPMLLILFVGSGLWIVFVLWRNLREHGIAVKMSEVVKGKYTVEELVVSDRLNGMHLVPGGGRFRMKHSLSDVERRTVARRRWAGSLAAALILYSGIQLNLQFGYGLAVINLGILILYAVWSNLLFSYSSLVIPEAGQK